jgi:hypothetical protein
MYFSHYYHTIRYLKAIQIGYQLWYRTRKKIRTLCSFSYPLHIRAKGESLQLIPFTSKHTSLEGEVTFTFLNQISSFTHWNDETNSKLWSYNLNYMDYLLQPDISVINARKWINQFISDIRENKNGLEPYPIALRGINWIKYISTHYSSVSSTERSRWNASLYAQYLILFDNIEYHLLGNHLLEDAFSLLWSSLYFQNEKIYRKAEKILYKELEEQLLKDGAHFERSPMYHCILLDRLLDCVNAVKFNIRFCKQEEVISLLEEKAVKMLGWLETIQYKDGTIPLLNDSVYGIAPIPAELFSYAERLGLKWNKMLLSDSGYRKYETSLLEMVIDIGKIGPDYIPGHAHADTFSYELKIDGKPFVVDTGISTYDKGSRRSYERGTSAHNTVILENLNSSQTWGGFRVGKRAHIISLVEENNFICSRHDGFKESGVTHERSWSFSSSSITIQDKLLAKKNVKGINRIIFSPNVIIRSISNDTIITNLGCICFSENLQIHKEIGDVAFEFNKLEKTTILSIYFVNNMQYTIYNMYE